MLTCPNPSCKKPLPALTRTCPSCQADLSLLVDYVGEMDDALGRAERLTRAGRLAEAVWAYLEVLEVDPENPTARRQVGRVAAAVRQFDRTAPGRRWRERLRRYGGLAGEGVRPGSWLNIAVVILLLLAAFFLGYQWGAADV